MRNFKLFKTEFNLFMIFNVDLMQNYMDQTKNSNYTEFQIKQVVKFYISRTYPAINNCKVNKLFVVSGTIVTEKTEIKND